MTLFEGNELLPIADRLGASFITRDERLYAPSWWNVTTLTANYTATYGDVYFDCDTTAGNITITLPAAADSFGKKFAFKKITSDANTVVIDGNASETIDGATTKTLSAQNDSLTIVCDGVVGWRILANVNAASGSVPTTTAYYVTCTTADVTVTLPRAALNANNTVIIKKIDATAFKVRAKVSVPDELDGQVGKSIADRWAAFGVRSDGVFWNLIFTNGYTVSDIKDSGALWALNWFGAGNGFPGSQRRKLRAYGRGALYLHGQSFGGL